MVLNEYDAGLLNDFGGGNVEWWQDYMRAELARAYDHYQLQIQAQGGWQPIETAPHDGTLVIVWPPTWNGVTSTARWHERERVWVRQDTTSVPRNNKMKPTHWQPVLQGPCE